MRGQHLKLKRKIRGERIRKRIETIKKRRLAGIWDVKRKIVKGKKQIQKSVKTEKGEIITEPKKILEEYERYYKELLKTKEAQTQEEKDFETLIQTQFADIREKATDVSDRESITPKLVGKAIRQMKGNKAKDRQGWSAEWLKNGGTALEKSLSCMFNRPR